jgi:hypothetical protein
MNIVEWLLSQGIATHWKQAENIIVGLQLGRLHNAGKYQEIKERAMLYRKWRARTDKKNDIPSWQAYELAIAGIDPDYVKPRQIELFSEVTE